jgi:hypothetical protein
VAENGRYSRGDQNGVAAKSSAEALLKAQVENIGLWVGFAVFAAIGILIYWLSHYLAHRLGEDASNIILAVPAFFAIFVVVPVRDRYVTFALRQYCSRHGHILDEFTSNKGQRVILCNRCDSTMIGN